MAAEPATVLAAFTDDACDCWLFCRRSGGKVAVARTVSTTGAGSLDFESSILEEIEEE
jgi:hypothetical protein